MSKESSTFPSSRQSSSHFNGSQESIIQKSGSISLAKVGVVAEHRTKVLVIMTTSFDENEFSLDEIADLYRCRWQAELHLRSLKVVLQMDQLRCKTSHRVRNEFHMHLLAYNLVRRVMMMAALDQNVPPW